MLSTTTFACLVIALAATQVSAHGSVVSPTPRKAGQNLLDVCGEQQWRFLAGFNNGNDLDGWFRDPSKDTPAPQADCNYQLCRGNRLEDNSTVWNWPAGTQVPMVVSIRNNHPGSANVSVTRTKDLSKVAIMNVWDGNALSAAGKPAYGQTKTTDTPNILPVDQWNFTVTIPDVGDNCKNVGDCVVEWYWYGALGVIGSGRPQEFESCFDFVQNSAVAFPTGSANMTGAAALAAQKLVGTAASGSNSTLPSLTVVAVNATTAAVPTMSGTANSTLPSPVVAAVNATTVAVPTASEAAVDSDCEDETTAPSMAAPTPALTPTAVVAAAAPTASPSEAAVDSDCEDETTSTEVSDCSDDESSSVAAPVPTPVVAAVNSVAPVADTPAVVVPAATPVVNAMPVVAAVSSPAVQSAAMAVPTNAYIPSAGGSSASMVAVSAALLAGALVFSTVSIFV